MNIFTEIIESAAFGTAVYIVALLCYSIAFYQVIRLVEFLKKKFRKR